MLWKHLRLNPSNNSLVWLLYSTLTGWNNLDLVSKSLMYGVMFLWQFWYCYAFCWTFMISYHHYCTGTKANTYAVTLHSFICIEIPSTNMNHWLPALNLLLFHCQKENFEPKCQFSLSVSRSFFTLTCAVCEKKED